MCLYPRLIENRKYRANQKNGGVIPPIPDDRVRFVPIGCQSCIECRKQKAAGWRVRLLEDIKHYKNAKFVTLTFNTESLIKLQRGTYTIMKRSRYKFVPAPWKQPIRIRKTKEKDISKLSGYDLDNAIVTKAMRFFLERWRKKFGKSLRHWFISELGDGHSEHVHLHGIVYTDNLSLLEDIWGYGSVWTGYKVDKKVQNYVTERTVNYMTKYVTKIDELHLNYKAVILCSPGIGNNFQKSGGVSHCEFKGNKTADYYRTSTGHKVSLPIYFRNKLYSESQREAIWLARLDRNERFVCGVKIDLNIYDEDAYMNKVMHAREQSIKLGYPSPEFIWKKKDYEHQRRKMLQQKRLQLEGWIN